MKQIAIITLLTILLTGNSISTNYNDVLVVVNSNSSVSVQVGNYFKAQRSIPSQNICTISCATNEEIDSLTFEQIRTSIQNYMTANGLISTINYIVTTKGIPLKVKRFGSTFSSNSTSSSFEGDLTMIFSNYTSYIGKPSIVVNPYYQSTANFSRAGFQNIYLVTRLDGYNYDNIKGLIDRGQQGYISTGKFVFDQDPSKSSSLNTNMTTANTTVTGRGFSSLLNTTSQFIVNQTDVLGYVSWGTNDSYWSGYTQKAQPHFTWSAKALAETYVSSSGRTFTDSTYIDPAIGTWQSLIADIIHENGITGAKGYVFEPFSSSMAKVNILFDRWTYKDGGGNSKYNLAESYFAASNYIGWMDVVLGDPKSMLYAEGPLPVQLVTFNGSIGTNDIKLSWQTATEINNYGFEIEKYTNSSWTKIGFVPGHGTVNTPQYYMFNDNNIAPKNSYRLKQVDRDGTYEYSHVINVNKGGKIGFTVEQNYPNPFSAGSSGNPTTKLTYSLSTESKIHILIYNVAGQLVQEVTSENPQTQGTYSYAWDGNSSQATPVASGTYFYTITAQNIADNSINSVTKKMTLLR